MGTFNGAGGNEPGMVSLGPEPMFSATLPAFGRNGTLKAASCAHFHLGDV